MGAFTNPWNVALPAGGSAASLGDDQIRQDKAALLERLLVEHDFPTGLTGSGRHKFPIGNTASRPADPSTGSLYINTETGMLEYYSGTAWVAGVTISLASYLLLAGGTMTGHLVLANNIYLQGKRTDGALRGLARVDAANQIVYGDVLSPLFFLSSIHPSVYVGATPYTLWNSGNDGDNSGLDADLLKGKDLTHIYNTGAAGYMYFTELGGPFIQWGTTVVGASATVTVTLPVAYIAAHRIAIATMSTDVSLDGSVGAIPFSLSQIKLFNNNSSSGVTLNWLSVGA